MHCNWRGSCVVISVVGTSSESLNVIWRLYQSCYSMGAIMLWLTVQCGTIPLLQLWHVEAVGR